MAKTITSFDRDAAAFDPSRLVYITSTGADEAKRTGLIPSDTAIADDARIYVLHGADGNTLGFSDTWETVYGTALRNDMTPVSVH